MFVRPVTRRAGRVLRNAPSAPRRNIQMPAGENAALKGTAPSAPGAKVGGGQNSLLVGTALLGATLAAGYVYGTAGSTNKKALGSLNAAAEKASKQVPKKAAQKAQEAKEATISATKQAAPSEPKPSSPKAASPPGPAVSSTGATEPLPSVSDSDDTVSVSSSLSDPGSISSEEEEEDPAQAAFNPETGEINWDCPCLGGMAHGVCGEQFKEAFSCFIYSTAEPKGQDCIEKFRGMQECFAAHPEVYGEVMGDDEEDEFEVVPSQSGDDDIVSAVEKALGGR